MEGAYTSAVEEVLRYFEVSEKNGLSNLQVIEARNKYGKNGEWGVGRRFRLFLGGSRDVLFIANPSCCSSTARTTYATMGTCVGAIQRPVGYHSASFCSCLLWPGFV